MGPSLVDKGRSGQIRMPPGLRQTVLGSGNGASRLPDSKTSVTKGAETIWSGEGREEVVEGPSHGEAAEYLQPGD